MAMTSALLSTRRGANSMGLGDAPALTRFTSGITCLLGLLPAGVADVGLRHHAVPFAAVDAVVCAAISGRARTRPPHDRRRCWRAHRSPPRAGGSRRRVIELVEVRHRDDGMLDQLEKGVVLLARESARWTSSVAHQRPPSASSARRTRRRRALSSGALAQRNCWLDQLGLTPRGELAVARDQARRSPRPASRRTSRAPRHADSGPAPRASSPPGPRPAP